MGLAAIYARVSSTRQKEEQTIASQTQALREHAAASGLEVPPGWIFEDEGYSGATLIRPALERLRDLAAEVDVPVVLAGEAQFGADPLVRVLRHRLGHLDREAVQIEIVLIPVVLEP